MPHHLIWEEKGLYRKFIDSVSGEEVLNSILAIQGDARFDSIRYVVNDFSQIIDFEVSDLDIKKIVIVDNVAAMTNPNIKIAIVATYEPLLQWIELYCEKMEDSLYECKIFDNIDEAYQWVPSKNNG